MDNTFWGVGNAAVGQTRCRARELKRLNFGSPFKKASEKKELKKCGRK